jgi:hypothetical protein
MISKWDKRRIGENKRKFQEGKDKQNHKLWMSSKEKQKPRGGFPLGPGSPMCQSTKH